jgi:hypothetical protein
MTWYDMVFNGIDQTALNSLVQDSKVKYNKEQMQVRTVYCTILKNRFHGHYGLIKRQQNHKMKETSYHTASHHVTLIITVIIHFMTVFALNLVQLFVRSPTHSDHKLPRKSNSNQSKRVKNRK